MPGNDLWDAVARPHVALSFADEREAYYEAHPQDRVTWAMNVWRSSFGDSHQIVKAVTGEIDDHEFVGHARAIIEGIRHGHTEHIGVRVDTRRLGMGETIDFPLISVAKGSLDASGYENLSNAFGLGDSRGVWYTLVDFPCVAFPDGREFITSGVFKVDNIVAPYRPSWEGTPGYDRTLNGKRVMIDMIYVGPSRSVKL